MQPPSRKRSSIYNRAAHPITITASLYRVNTKTPHHGGISGKGEKKTVHGTLGPQQKKVMMKKKKRKKDKVVQRGYEDEYRT
jgi:hypothetical protein